MASATDEYIMTTVAGRAEYQATTRAVPLGITASTDRRDVSEALDLLALSDTPFINKIGWGPDCGTQVIEWLSEDLGPGYIQNEVALLTACLSITVNTTDGTDVTDIVLQLTKGTVLYNWCSVAGTHNMSVITSFEAGTTYPTVGTLVVSTLAAGGYGAATTAPINTKFYILGNYANEGSRPNIGQPRKRVLSSNPFTILRKDVAITGSMKANDFYAIGREDRHQILMRMKEMQRQREKTALYSGALARTSIAAGMMNGVLGFLTQRSGDHINTADHVLTESAFNTVVGAVWENGGTSLTAYGSRQQIGKFTQWDRNRIRTRVNDSKGGGHITSYLSEVGVEVDLVPMRKVPNNVLFVLDTSKIKMRAKRGRKAILEKLGKMGDFDDWQLLSEFSMEMKGYNLGQHGLFQQLT